MTFSIWAGVAIGFEDKYRAAAPATCGEAIEVPERTSVPPPLLVERIMTPGAQMSTQLTQLLNPASCSLASVAATVISPSMGPRRDGEPLHASVLSFPAATA